jgi:hypothetical protein
VRRSLCLFAALSLGLAPLPFPRPVDPQRLDELARSAKEAEDAAARLLQGDLLAAERPTREQKDEINRRWRAEVERAAREYARLAALVDALPRPGPAEQRRAYEANLGAGRASRALGRYREALPFLGRAADRSPSPTGRLRALGQVVSCHAVLRDEAGMRRALSLIKEVAPRLEERERLAWELWVVEVEGELKAGKPRP